MDLHAEDREALRAIQQVFQKAVENNTIGDVREHAHEDFSYVSFTDKSFESFDAFEKQWKISRAEMIGNGSFISELNPETSLFFDDIAVCMGNASSQMVDKDGQYFEYNSNWTVVFKRSDGVWKALRAHNSLDPFANPMMMSRVKKMILKYSAMAFLVGGVACALATYFLVR